MPNLGTPEILIIAVVVVLLFGATKLPQMARSLGQSARVFKAETRGMKKDEAATSQDQSSDAPAQQPPQQLTSGEQSSAPFSQANGQAQGQSSQQTQGQSSQQNDSKN